MNRLDLDRPRDLAAIISTALSTWWSHLGVFVAIAAIVAFPVSFLVDGVWAGRLADPDETPSVAAQLGGLAVWALVGPFVTALSVLVVLGLARGEHPTLGAALRAGWHVLPRVLVVTVLYVLATILGFALFVIPGVFVAVACYFAAQAAVVEEHRGVGALRRSWELVKGSWWRTFGIVVVLSIISALLALPLGFVTQMIGAAADNGPLFVLGTAIAQTVTLSFVAVAATLLFFDLRTRKAATPAAPTWQAPQPDPGLSAPERPF